MLTMYLGLPLGFIMKFALKGALIRHLFAIITGVILQAYMYRSGIIHPFIMTFVTYLLMNVLPRN